MNQNVKKEVILNNDIKATRVMLFDKEGEKVGQMSIAEAKSRAEALDLDLMQLNETKEFTVVKMLNYDSWRYHEEKKRHKQEVKNRSQEMKEIQFSPVIGDHDFDVKAGKCIEFLEAGHKVKVFLKLKGRQHNNRVGNDDVIKKIKDTLSVYGVLDGQLKSEGKGMAFIIRPEKKVEVKVKEDTVVSVSVSGTTDSNIKPKEVVKVRIKN